MTKDEALKEALDALGPTPPDCCGCKTEWQIAITAIKAALEAKDEPDQYAMDIECTKCGAKQSGVLTVHTTPPQHKPLTNQQIAKILEHGDVAESNDKIGWYVLPYSFARAIEAAHGIKGEA